MKLYMVRYKTWNMFFSDLIDREMISVGKDQEDAICRVKDVVDKDARDFKAEEIEKVFGCTISVIENEMDSLDSRIHAASAQTTASRSDISRLSDQCKQRT